MGKVVKRVNLAINSSLETNKMNKHYFRQWRARVKKIDELTSLVLRGKKRQRF